MKLKKYMMCSDIQVRDFPTFLLSLSRQKCMNMILEYNAQTKCPTDETEDCEYARKVIKVIPWTEKALKEQFLTGVSEDGNEVIISRRGRGTFKEAFMEGMERAAISCLENFGVPTVCVKISKTEYVVGSIEPDNLALKEISPLVGCIMVYTPKRFARFKVTK